MVPAEHGNESPKLCKVIEGIGCRCTNHHKNPQTLFNKIKLRFVQLPVGGRRVRCGKNGPHEQQPPPMMYLVGAVTGEG